MIEVGASLPQIAQDVTADPGNVAAGTVLTLSVTLAGVTPNQTFSVSAPDLESGLYLLTARCHAAGTLLIPIYNPTGGDINPASQSFKIVAH